jgi:hypothetical protein
MICNDINQNLTFKLVCLVCKCFSSTSYYILKIGVGAIALAQLVGGAALAVFTLGAGSTIGMGLMSEGVADLITMVKDGIINRNFSWESYGIQKAISMTVSLVYAGFKAIKDVAKTAYAGMKSIQTAMTTTVKAGWQLAAKAMGVSLAKGVAKELVTQLVDYGVNQALMPSIQQEVMKRIEKPIQDALLKNPNVKKMLELDGKNRNNYYQSLIKNKAMELLNPQQDKEHALLTITKGIAKGIATNKIQGLSTILQVADAIQALDKLDEFVPNFIDSLNKAIEELSKNEKVDEKFMEFNRQNNTKETEIIQIANDAHDVNYTSNYILEKEEGDIEDKIGKDTKDEEQIQLERGNKSPEELRKGLASSVSVNMCNIIQSKLITPLTHAGIDYGINKLTAGLDKHIQDGIGNFQAERRIEFFQDGDKDNRIDEEFKQGIHDKAAVAKADSMIDDLKNGGEAGLPHLGPLSDEAGRPIKVLDEHGNHVRTIGGDKGGEPIEVQYHKPNKDNPWGHWTLPDGKDAPSSGEKNCLFDVVAAQTKKDPNQLRANTAQRMENNKAMVANQAHDIKRLEIYKKDALTMGAGLKNEKTRMQQKMDRYRKKGFSEDQIRNEISKDLEKRLDKLKTDKSGVLISALRKDLELYKLYDSVSMNHEVEKLGQIIYLLEKIDTLDPKKSTEFINGGFLEINDKDKKMLKGLTSLGTNQDGQDQLIHSGDFIKQLKFSHDNGKTVIKLESHRSQDVKIANKELSENVTKSEHNFTLGLQVSKVKIVKAFEVEGNVGLQYQYNNSTSTTSKKLDYTIFESENLSRYLTGLTEGCTTTSQFGNSKYYNGLYGIGSLKLDMQDLQEKAFWSDDEN